MTKESTMEQAAQESLAKFARERDVFVEKPELKALKEETQTHIEGCFEVLDALEKKKLDLKNALFELETEIQKYTTIKENLAIAAFNLQEQGIFWASKVFVVKKPQEPKLDTKAMYAQLSDEKKNQYTTYTKQMVEQITTTIDWDKLISTEPKIYTKTNPVLAKKPHKGAK